MTSLHGERVPGFELESTRGDTVPLAEALDDGVVRYEQVADHPADRTYGNWVRYSDRNGFEDAFA